MSSALSEDATAVFRRMVSLPRTILGGLSRAVGQGIDLIAVNGRRNHLLHPPPHPPSAVATDQPFFPLEYPQDPRMVENPYTFLSIFEHTYGSTHPFFYACRFMDALKIARDEHKLLFLYLHTDRDPNFETFTSSFCRETLCSEVMVQFIDANFVSWAGLADRGEGLLMGHTLRPATFPFCAVIAPAPGDNISVLQQIEGPVSPAEMLEILQKTMEEQGVAFGSLHHLEEETKTVDRQLKEEQDAAYLATLRIDQEKERQKNLVPTGSTDKAQKQTENVRKPGTPAVSNAGQRSLSAMFKKAKEATSAVIRSEDQLQKKKEAKILVRFPNGERREQAFGTKDKVKEIFRFVDSLDLVCEGSYRLVSSFPRKVYGVDGQKNVTIKDAGLYPRATLFLEPL